MGNFGGSSEDRDERKTSSYSDQFNRNYKVKGGKVKKKNIIDKGIDFVKKGGVVGAAIGDKVSDFTNKRNLERRKKFISNYNTNVPPSERINLTDKQITSKEGLSKLKSQGYTTVTDTSKDTRNDRDPQYNPNQGIKMANAAGSDAATAQQKAVSDAPTGPTSIEMNNQEDTEAQRLIKIKKKGRRATILNVPEEEVTLDKKYLLG